MARYIDTVPLHRDAFRGVQPVGAMTAGEPWRRPAPPAGPALGDRVVLGDDHSRQPLSPSDLALCRAAGAAGGCAGRSRLGGPRPRRALPGMARPGGEGVRLLR